MRNGIGFVNREEELAQISRLIGKWGSLRILCVTGMGGVGKTRLLERVHELYGEGKRRSERILVTKRIDFDDPALHVSETLGRRIAEELDEEHFEGYINALLDWRRMEAADISRARLAEEGERVDRVFLECFNKVSRDRRVVLLMDTIEQTQGTDVWLYHQKLASQLSNTLVIVAGREADQLTRSLISWTGVDAVQLMSLDPLQTASAEEYLRKKQDSLPVMLDPETADKILALAAGRPLLIDLAVEWVARKVPMPLLHKRPEDLRSLSRSEQAEIEKALIKPIGRLHTPRDRLLWIMALVWPLDERMAGRLTHWTPEKVGSVWHEIEPLSFVKQLPNGSLMLHDVVRELILRHLRPEIEPEREQRWFSDALAYLHDLRNSLQNQLEDLESAEQQARETGNERQAWNLFVEREATERALWTIHGQYLGYLLLSDAENGLAAFEKAWEQATEEYRFSYRAVLISQVQKFRDRLSLDPTQEYRIDLRRAQYFLDGGMYEQAERLLRTVLERFEDTPGRQVELLIQLGNVVIRRGQFEEGLSLFDRATQISREQSIPKWLVRALNALGWASRLMGRLEEATRHYHSALKLSLDLQDEWRQAWLMNNLGYVHALRRNRDTALRLCEQALELWKDIGFERGIGATYNTLGEIAIEFDQLETAVSYFNNALDIFESEQDFEWLSSAYCGRGAAFWLLGDLNEAQEDLERARDIGLERDRPIVLHRLAHVYLERRDYEEAKRLFEESYQVSRAAPDPFYELNSLGDLARIAILEKEWEKKDEISSRFTDFKERHHGIRYRLPEGLLLRYLGDLNLCAGEIDKAASLYEEALPLIAESGSYQPYTITGQIRDMETIVLPNIDTKQIQNLGRHLEQVWAVERYDETHPEALPFFAHWKTWRRAG